MHKEALLEIFKATLEELYLERIYSDDNGLINKSLTELPKNKDVSFIIKPITPDHFIIYKTIPFKAELF